MTNHFDSKLLDYMLFIKEEWTFYFAVSGGQLCFVGANHGEIEELMDWQAAHCPECTLKEEPDKLKPFSEQFAQYFDGKRSAFTFPLLMNGTIFQEKIWRALQNVPYGTFISYSELAERTGYKNASRAVGTAVGKNPLLIVVPCHRVIRKDGKPSGFRGGLRMKESLIDLENRMKTKI